MKQQSVSTVDLVILGFLVTQELSAYDLARLIETKHANKLVKISTPAVYKTCKRLHASGFIVQKGGAKHSEKIVYSISKSGRGYFLFLMKHFSSHIEPFFFGFNAFLYHIQTLSKKDGLSMLESLEGELLLLKEWITAHEKEIMQDAPFASKAIVKQYRMVIATLCLWCKDVVRDYKAL